jgi:hypothetical protein
VVFFERETVLLDGARDMIGDVAWLRSQGVTADEIAGGRLKSRTAFRVGLEAKAAMARLGRWRGARLLYLLAWMLKREHAEEFIP